MKIFIVGSGRSGTHMVGELLNSTGAFTYEPEVQPLFDMSCQISIYNKFNIIDDYLNLYKNKQLYIDKCHPNLFIVPEIKRAFPDSLIIYVHRDKEQIINSMMKHKGIQYWYDADLPYPNNFLNLEKKVDFHDLTESEQRRVLAKRIEGHEAIYQEYKHLMFKFDYNNAFDSCKKLEKMLKLKIDTSIINKKKL